MTDAASGTSRADAPASWRQSGENADRQRTFRIFPQAGKGIAHRLERFRDRGSKLPAKFGQFHLSRHTQKQGAPTRSSNIFI